MASQEEEENSLFEIPFTENQSIDDDFNQEKHFSNNYKKEKIQKVRPKKMNELSFSENDDQFERNSMNEENKKSTQPLIKKIPTQKLLMKKKHSKNDKNTKNEKFSFQENKNSIISEKKNESEQIMDVKIEEKKIAPSPKSKICAEELNNQSLPNSIQKENEVTATYRNFLVYSFPSHTKFCKRLKIKLFFRFEKWNNF